ncbi:MAG: hypothetical protein KAT35_01130, partial [Candidatus Aenigmarchaeota archaeon]|nr:hypothetical protein [Candidatus Aenigmarchaeota archaeon]
FGFLAVVGGVGISWMIPVFSEFYIYKVLQSLFINVIIGGIIATSVFFLALKLISYNIFNIPGIESEIDRLHRLKNKALDIERKERSGKRQGIRHPIRIAGLGVLAGFLIIGLVGFTGFPNPMDEMGFSQDELDNMADQMESINENYGDKIAEILGDTERLGECMGAAEILQDQSVLSDAQPYTDLATKRMVEEYAGEFVTEMYQFRSGEDVYILSLTENQACLSTPTVMCLCQEGTGLEA